MAGPFVGDGQDPLDERGVGRFSVGGVAEHGADGGEAGVAGAHGVVPFVFEVVQEPGDQRGVEIDEVELGGLFAGVAGGRRPNSSRNVSR